MEILLNVSVDGQPVNLNEDLHSAITTIIANYVREKLGGKRVGKLGIPRFQNTPKDPNAPKQSRWTEEQWTDLVSKVKVLEVQGKNNLEIATILAPTFNTSFSSIAYKLIKLRASGKLDKYNPNSIQYSLSRQNPNKKKDEKDNFNFSN